MHVGYSSLFQNLSGRLTDAEVVSGELAMAELAEPLGFDSVWAPEHHFTNYELIPETIQFLTWIAAKTERVQLGSMISVLPWHDPLRLVEQWTTLDHYSGGRAILGMGRGLGRVEFDSFQTDMAESRGRFTEYASAIVGALESGYIEYDGEFLRQPRTAIRPFPVNSFRGRTYASAVSPESIDLMADLGVGLLIIAQKPWHITTAEIERYRDRYLEVNGEPPPGPIIAVFVAVHEDPEEAQRMFDEYLMNYSESAIDHYQLDEPGIATIPGYEYYAATSDIIAKHGRKRFAKFLAELQVWGTPDEVVGQLKHYQELVGAAGIISIFSYGGMPLDEAEANLRLFAESVLPALQGHDVEFEVGGAGPPTAVAERLSATSVTW